MTATSKAPKLLPILWLLCFAVTASAASGVDYPTRPVRLLVPFAPGGSADVIGRIVVPRLSDATGQPWVVDNRGGAAGNIAAELTARAAPDGHTVFLGLSSVVTSNPALYKLPFSMDRDLQPVTQLTSSQYLLILNPGVAASNTRELVALAKQKPGSLNYSSGGIGTPPHLVTELFKKRAGIELRHVPYKGGALATTAVVSGETQLAVVSVAAAMQLVKAGRLKAIATTGPKRSEITPDLPTLLEAGYPDVEIVSWYGLLVPSGTPGAIVDNIRTHPIKVVQIREVQESLASQGLQVETSTPKEFAARIRRETRLWADVINAAGIKAE